MGKLLYCCLLILVFVYSWLHLFTCLPELLYQKATISQVCQGRETVVEGQGRFV